jgi:two-component system, chemotaxis family, sensor kinase CheA
MSIADREIITEFVIEAQEGLADVERQMLAIEAGGADIEPDLVNAVFRTMHSIKGTAGFLGLERIGSLAHRLEELLNLMRNRELIPTRELVTIMLNAADFMSDLIESVDTSNDVDISVHVQALDTFLSSPLQMESVADPCGEATNSAESASEAELVTSNASSEAIREFLIESYDNLEQMDRDLVALEQAPASPDLLRSIFRTMHTIKGGAGFLGLGDLEQLAHAAENVLGKLRDGVAALSPSTMSVLLETTDQCRHGLQLLENGNATLFHPHETIVRLQSSCAPIDPANSTAAAFVKRPQPTAIVPDCKGAADTGPSRNAAASADKAAPSIGDSTIRVDVSLLDKLMTRVGELVLARNQILQHASRIENTEVTSAAQRLNLITTELQEGVMKTRMQPIGNVWAKFPRVVRDLAFQLNKQIRIELEGKETELDKTIIEAIKDPLTHLVRNSVDHGIEAPSVRAAAGKAPEGRILLRAYHEGGQVNIEISDDGAGLNLDRIRKKAVEKGILSADQANRLTDQDASNLIFAAGFSTADQVTSVSGRGVGMDVVKTNIERIGGVIDVQSRSGVGSTVKIKIPLTLAIIPALTVMCDGDCYAIPQVSLLELVRLEGDEARSRIEFIHGAPVYRLRGKLLPLVNLSERLGLKSPGMGAVRSEQGEAVNIVVLRADDRQFGLIVDKVCDTEEIVVKPLGKQLKRISEYAGTTIMGDGGVALILDVKGLATASGLAGELRAKNIHESAEEAQHGIDSQQSVLLVDVGDARRYALPISMVARLEKIASESIELANGCEVIQYRGNILPLMRLTKIVGAPAELPQEQESVQVVVYDQNDITFGLIVGRILDSCEVELRQSAVDAPGGHLLGSYVIQQRVTDVVDMHYLSRHLQKSVSTINA